MFKIILFLILLLVSLSSTELVVIANKDFPKKELSLYEVQAIFLDKRDFFNEKRVLVMNFESGNPLRSCFEKKILKKSKRSLERYWKRAYYQGMRPPKVVKSFKMLFSYLSRVSPSIGYSDKNHTIDSNVTILYHVNCE